MKRIQIDTTSIHDWASFHEVFKEALGFPDFFGANMDAWIDCMSYLRDPSGAMSKVTIDPGELLLLEALSTVEFKRRCPEQFNELVECTASVRRAVSWNTCL